MLKFLNFQTRTALCARRVETRNGLNAVITNHSPTAQEIRFFFSNFHLVVVKPFNNRDAYIHIYMIIYTRTRCARKSLLHLWSLPLHHQVLVKPTRCITHMWYTLCLGINMERLVKSSFTSIMRAVHNRETIYLFHAKYLIHIILKSNGIVDTIKYSN